MSLTNLCYKSLYNIIPQLLNFSLTHTQSRLTLHSYFLTKKAYLGWLGDLDKFLHHLTTVIFANLVMTFKKSYILDCLGIRVLYFNVFTYSLVQMHNTAYTRSTVVVVTADLLLWLLQQYMLLYLLYIIFLSFTASIMI